MSTQTKAGSEPAYPHEDAPQNWTGLTKRELFAAMAMQARLGNPVLVQAGHAEPVAVAEEAIEYADALLAELEKAHG